MKFECEECARLHGLLEELRMRLYQVLDEKAHLGSPDVLEAATAFDVALNEFHRHLWKHEKEHVYANAQLAVGKHSRTEPAAAR